MTEASLPPSREDKTWARQLVALHRLLQGCDSRSEDAALLLSTCRNAYLTVNAQFTDLCVLLGDGQDSKADLRGGAELLIQRADSTKLGDRFGRATATVREYEKKATVWHERDSLYAVIESSLNELEKNDAEKADEVRSLLGSTKASKPDYDQGEALAFLRLDLAEMPHLKLYFDELDKCFSVLRACAALGMQVSRSLGVTQLDLLERRSESERPRRALDSISTLMTNVAKACDWSTTANTIEIVPGYTRPGRLSPITSVSIPPVETREALVEASEKLGRFIREALYYVHWRLGVRFAPNVGVARMPPPFEIELPPPTIKHANGEHPSLILDPIRCADKRVVSDSPRVAIAHLAVPTAKINSTTFGIDAPEDREDIARDVRLAVAAAKQEGCKAIVFPEYSIPASMKPELMALCVDNDLIIIGGLEGEWPQGRLCDPVAVAIPGESKLHFQNKQIQSLDETANFYRDNMLRLFTSTEIGHFAVIVCSDFLEQFTHSAWNANEVLPDVLFVVARNKYHELYVDFAKTDSYRLYTCVVIANVHDDKVSPTSNLGSCVVVPSASERVLKSTDVLVEGVYLTKLSVHELPVYATRARSNGKAAPGFLAVPRSL